MATNKFLEFDEAKADMLDDTQYEADAQRTNGISTGLARSVFHNKLYRQFSVMVSAIGQVISDAGINADDGSKTTLVASIKNVFFKAKSQMLEAETAELYGLTGTDANVDKIIKEGLSLPGVILSIAHTTVPAGYLLCNGSAISRITYSKLFDLIGTSYGAGNGSTTFNVPDLRGIFLRGFDNSRGADVGRVFGVEQAASKIQNGYWYGVPVIDGELPQNITSGRFGGGSPTSTSMEFVQIRPRNNTVNYVIKY